MLACVALAQEPEVPSGGQKEDQVRAPRRPGYGMMTPGRGMMPRGEMGFGMQGDQVVMAALNPNIAEKIGLSDEVQLKIKQIDIDSRKEIKDLQQKTQVAMEKQANLLKETKVDEDAVMAAIDELFDLRKEMAKVQTKRLIAIKALLSPEQLEKATEEVKRVREEFRSRRPNGMNDPRPGQNGPRPGGKERRDNRPGDHPTPPADKE